MIRFFAVTCSRNFLQARIPHSDHVASLFLTFAEATSWCIPFYLLSTGWRRRKKVTSIKARVWKQRSFRILETRFCFACLMRLKIWCEKLNNAVRTHKKKTKKAREGGGGGASAVRQAVKKKKLRLYVFNKEGRQ